MWLMFENAWLYNKKNTKVKMRLCGKSAGWHYRGFTINPNVDVDWIFPGLLRKKANKRLSDSKKREFIKLNIDRRYGQNSKNTFWLWQKSLIYETPNKFDYPLTSRAIPNFWEFILHWIYGYSCLI
jgi:hypothetical protein